jgi:hypothetical protein
MQSAFSERIRGCLTYLHEEDAMFDLALLALGIVLFAVSIGYAYACDRA